MVVVRLQRVLVIAAFAMGIGGVCVGQDVADSSAAGAALDRARAEAASKGESSAVARLRSRDRSVVSRVRYGRGNEGDPIFRNGVPYYEGWKVQAGVTLLKLPAYPYWESVKAGTDFFRVQSAVGVKGDHLEFAMLDRGFMRAVRTRYVSNFTLVWVPQEHAFKQMTLATFSNFKEKLQAEAVAERKLKVKRSDFEDFEDYLNFKFGHDEKVASFVDGFMIRALEAENLVMYFATSEFIFEGKRGRKVVDPMIMTVTYALVNSKLIRVDMKRLFQDAEDVAVLVAFSEQYVNDMRRLNALSTAKRPR